ncbi:MAG: hypothetical protein CSA70_01085 [Rhodobacterales bacterium]|nr:MAG: hypothetical protein CSA70_01085 [Rhodobacterales bacterium]
MVLFFLFANIAVAFLLNRLGVNIFGRSIKRYEFYLSFVIITFIPNSGLFWVFLDLTSLDILMDTRELLRPALWVTALLSAVACHAVVNRILEKEHEDGKF